MLPTVGASHTRPLWAWLPAPCSGKSVPPTHLAHHALAAPPSRLCRVGPRTAITMGGCRPVSRIWRWFFFKIFFRTAPGPAPPRPAPASATAPAPRRGARSLAPPAPSPRRGAQLAGTRPGWLLGSSRAATVGLPPPKPEPRAPRRSRRARTFPRPWPRARVGKPLALSVVNRPRQWIQLPAAIAEVGLFDATHRPGGRHTTPGGCDRVGALLWVRLPAQWRISSRRPPLGRYFFSVRRPPAGIARTAGRRPLAARGLGLAGRGSAGAVARARDRSGHGRTGRVGRDRPRAAATLVGWARGQMPASNNVPILRDGVVLLYQARARTRPYGHDEEAIA
jgi:hypothetical protein